MTATFSDQVTLVAGGTGGLGRAVSLAFLAAGAGVVVTYRNPDEFSALQKAAGPSASMLEGHAVDVTDENAVSQLVAQILSKHGRLNAMVNTVGAYAGGVKLWELDTKVFDRMLSLNLRTGYALSRAAVVPHAQAEARSDRERCGQGRIRSCRWSVSLRSLESRCLGHA